MVAIAETKCSRPDVLFRRRDPAEFKFNTLPCGHVSAGTILVDKQGERVGHAIEKIEGFSICAGTEASGWSRRTDLSF
jgi:hypothetical protein